MTRSRLPLIITKAARLLRCIAHCREAPLMRYRFPYVGADLCKPVLYSQASANTARPRIRAGVLRDMPVYFPSFAGYTHSSLTTEGGLRLSRPGCMVLRRGGLPVPRRSPTQALTGPSVESNVLLLH